MILFQVIIAVVVAYLIGSIPTSIWIGKLVYGIDIRKEGSGNAGTTNVIRVLGWKAGIPVLVFDILKGWVAVKLSYYFPGDLLSTAGMDYLRIALAIAAVIGHIFPVYENLKGGKGVATLLGVGIALYGYSVLYAIGLFIAILLIFRYVSLASILSAVAFPFIVIFIDGIDSLPMIILAIAIAVFISFTHRRNIVRLIKGDELKFSFKKKSKTNS
ncbi:MAG: glycerol-3-phosphate 1-O-acyltransferase PlsY [Bacteroidetes bacterium]|nr:glycerol-3-phosphate 1-O-acyltransferase PlsY [Bacteroidota bacterium]